ncbi:hypothetical protein DPMN_025695 [Dreissena polymorpha]|uniref:Sulfotransferase domain-containing protein n=1 Tax=Dreissena polymorpha TaxID=45954 RepID=A0A9D4LTR3_DREPO|nr:hypothetical protein DPMN_025695 [Dreissena polymorpha]
MTLKIESKNVADRRAKYCNFQADTTKMASASHGRVYAYNAYNHPTFTLNFKNPCFLQGVNYKSSEDIRCVPYFLLPGFPKCATTSVWEGLKVHPRIKLLHFKEPNFLHRLDRGGLPFTDAVKNYTDTFAESTKAIMSSPHFVNRETFYDQITGEASVDYSFDNRYWPLYPGNENCREPAVTLADFAHRLNPNMKIIFVVRDPVERLYSDYVFESLFLGYPVSKQGFHQRVLSTIAAHKLCRKYQSARACAYNSSLETWEVRLRVGMYHVFIEDWAAVFTANNIAVIRTEELDEDRKLETYRKLFKFLDVRELTPLEEKALLSKANFNIGTTKLVVGPMMHETKKILQDFYRPFNKKLSKLIPYITYNY